MLKNQKITVGVGPARSGTSLLVLILKTAGFNVFGKRWPLMAEEPEIEGDQWSKQCKEYTRDKNEPPEIRNLRESKIKKMNRSGFWENNLFTIKGLARNLETMDLIVEIQNSEKPPAGKIVSSGLIDTDPTLIGQVIYTMRDPHKVAKSQEQLKRVDLMLNGIPIDFAADIKIHSPEAYIKDTYQACRWFLAHPEVPVYFYNYDDLIDNPEKILSEMQTFMSGNIDMQNIDIVKAGLEVIEPSARRSEVEDIPNLLWTEAEFVYDKFSQGKFQDIIDYLEKEDERLIHTEARQWFCHRADVTVNEELCRQCRAKPSNFIRLRVESLRNSFVFWDKEPCMAECGESLSIPENEYITIAESIENNFWVDAVKDLMKCEPEQIRGRLINEPFMQKLSDTGDHLIHKIDDKNARRIVEYLCEGIPTAMLADHLEATEGNLLKFLMDKFGRFHLSGILLRQQAHENYSLNNFKFEAARYIKQNPSDELNAFIKGLSIEK